jgi:hypothetical protein
MALAALIVTLAEKVTVMVSLTCNAVLTGAEKIRVLIVVLLLMLTFCV